MCLACFQNILFSPLPGLFEAGSLICHFLLPQDQPPIDHGKGASLPLIQASETVSQSNSSRLLLSGILSEMKH